METPTFTSLSLSLSLFLLLTQYIHKHMILHIITMTGTRIGFDWHCTDVGIDITIYTYKSYIYSRGRWKLVWYASRFIIIYYMILLNYLCHLHSLRYKTRCIIHIQRINTILHAHRPHRRVVYSNNMLCTL